jgi:hypothetical protein
MFFYYIQEKIYLIRNEAQTNNLVLSMIQKRKKNH